MKPFYRTVLTLAAIPAFCLAANANPTVIVKFAQNPSSVVNFYYEVKGENQFADIEPDATGIVRFEPQVFEENGIVNIMADGKLYGAICQDGKTTTINVADGTATATGDNAAASNFLNSLGQGFSYLKFKPGPNNPFNCESWQKAIDSARAEATKELQQIPQGQRKYFEELLNGTYNQRQLTIFQMDQMQNEKNHDQEVAAIIAAIDPNSDASRHSGLLSTWQYYAPEMRAAVKASAKQGIEAQMEAVNQLVTNKANRNSIFDQLIAYDLMMYRDDWQSMQKALEALMPYLKDAPGVVANAQKTIDQVKNQVQDGMAFPCDPVIIAPDGAKTTLASQLDGKVVYVDLWATWCAPCCREIPFMEKLYEKYKDNDQIKLISISCDTDLEAWHRKLAKDNPQWPNFVFDKKTGDEFMNALNATGIPRFFLIGRDGRFIQVNAKRPSDPAAAQAIEAAVAAN